MIWLASFIAILAGTLAAVLGYRLRRLRADLRRLEAEKSEQLVAFQRSDLATCLLERAFFEAALAAGPDAVFVIDSAGRIRPANPAASALLKTLSPCPPRLEDLPIDRRAIEGLRQILSGARSDGGQLELQQALPVRIENRERRLLPRWTPIADTADGKPGALLTLSDVTEFAQLDAMRLDLVAVASHEFRTPVTTLRMTLLLLKEGRLSPRQEDLLATALLGVEQLATTMEEFLDLTRVEAGQLRLTWDRLHMPALIGKVLRTLKTTAADTGVTLSADYRDGAPEVIWADPARIRVVLSNVVGNAIKYTPRDGSVTVRSSLQIPGPAGEPKLQIEVTDSGPGIPPEFRERVFERLFRVEQMRQAGDAARSGTGIGLYLSREIVEAHGGTIRCEAGDDGKGTRIVLTLPASRREERSGDSPVTKT